MGSSLLAERRTSHDAYTPLIGSDRLGRSPEDHSDRLCRWSGFLAGNCRFRLAERFGPGRPRMDRRLVPYQRRSSASSHREDQTAGLTNTTRPIAASTARKTPTAIQCLSFHVLVGSIMAARSSPLRIKRSDMRRFPPPAKRERVCAGRNAAGEAEILLTASRPNRR